jgi:hypothetical protein
VISGYGSLAHQEIFLPMNLKTLACGGLLVALFCLRGWSQSDETSAPPKPSFDPDDVVAVIGGEEFTVKRVEHMRKNMPLAFQRNTANMSNRTFLQVYGELVAVSKMAEQEKIVEKEPYRFQLEFNRMNFLAGVYVNELTRSLPISKDEQREYYENHKSDYEQVKVSAIYVDYSPDPQAATDPATKKVLSEQEAWAKAEKIAADLRAGADFTETAKEHSDDEVSAQKGGDLGFFQRDSKIPQPLKDAIFQLKAEEISAPVKDGGRFYVFKVTERQPRPLTEVAGQVVERIQAQKLKTRLDEIRATVPIEYKNDAYLQLKPTPAPTPAAAR